MALKLWMYRRLGVIILNGEIRPIPYLRNGMSIHLENFSYTFELRFHDTMQYKNDFLPNNSFDKSWINKA